MLSRTPPMGFNTWNTFGENINESVIKETADAMVEKGLLEAGYNYLVIDDCWSERERDPETGKIVPDKIKFPNGMKAVSDYVHSKGLKFGMYSCAGTMSSLMPAPLPNTARISLNMTSAISRMSLTVRFFTERWAWRSRRAAGRSFFPPATGATMRSTHGFVPQVLICIAPQAISTILSPR